ncbi:MAG: prepilin-type N-terminal cleavage/methylation domain-containing protein [Opitutaceae bacterium]|nr:prepilin-type N-terminal cleavage/methylation domain-containing protein [Verrucomicrobiales bacterium]
MNKRRQNAGFSLVEVMCAILILGVAMVGLTTGITTALGSGKESELQTAAALIAAGQIEMVRADGILVDGVEEGEGAEGLSLYRWQRTITTTPVEGLHEVAVTVNHAKSGKAIYELRTLLFEPASDTALDKRPTQKESKKSRKGDRKN